MFLWIAIIIGVFTAYLGYKKGLFVMFATFFNIMFAVFIAVLSTPKLLSFSTGYEESGYCAAISVILLFILVFGVSQFFAYFYFLRDSDDLFPQLLDKFGAMIFGFLSGYVVCCVLILSFCITPCSAKTGTNHFCSREQLQGISKPVIRKVCDFLGWYSLHCFEGNSDKAIERLTALAKETLPEDGPEVDNGMLLPDTTGQIP